MKGLYSRLDAVEYALAYGLSPNPEYKYFGIYGENGGNCTNFTSQCLKAGGAPMVHDKFAPWWYSSTESINQTSHTWSLSWSVAHSLYWCIKKRTERKLYGIKGTEVNDVKLLELGDLIFYENFKGVINHSSIITEIKNGIPLISQHSFEAVNIPYIKGNKSKMHFMKLDF
jgi:hypothetical protein